jgi:Tol biopolymer transport system component
LKLYRFDLHSHDLTLIQSNSGRDDHDPAVVGRDLYWVSTRVTNSVAIVPSTGGATRELIAGQASNLPSWSSDGKEIAFVVGQYRLVDLPLDLDVAIANIDDRARLTTAPRMFIVGNNEDFPPSWSPDGHWIAWHSHRAPHDLPYAHAAGATDDIWLRSAKDTSAPEIRLTEGGRDAGWVYWALDGRSVIYSISDRKGSSDALQVRITNIDPLMGRALGEERLNLPSRIQNPVIVEWSPQGDELAIEVR